MINATIREFIGNQAFSANGSKTPFSFTGNQSFLSSIHPSEAALEMNPFSALNCNARPNVKNVGKARIGANHLDLAIGSSASRILARTIKNVMNARIPPISGLATHDMTTFLTTSQSISEALCCTSRTNPTPTIPPIIECVVETGSPKRVAIVNQTAAAIIAAMNPNIKSFANASVTRASSARSIFRIPFLTVSVTASPAKKAPQNSNTAAIITACLNVKALEPTEVPIALATSLAPMFHAM